MFTQSLRINGVYTKVTKVLQSTWAGHPRLPAASRGIHVDSPPIAPSLITSYASGISTTPFILHTVGESLQRTVERFPDREALVFVEQGVRKTFAQFQQDVDRAAAGLLAIGLTKGDRLCMWGPNSYEWILMQFATAKAGIILVCLNPANQAQETEYSLQKVQCKAVVCPTQFKSQKYCDILSQICPEIELSSPGNIKSARLPDLRSVIVLDSRQPGMLSFEDLMQAGGGQYVQQLQDLQKKLSCDDPINILFTSGSTGFPKAATLSHFNIVNNSNFMGKRLRYYSQSDVRICVPVPLFHAFGAVIGGMNMGVNGTSLIFPSADYKIKTILETLQNERCTVLFGTATMFVDLINHPDLTKYDLSSVNGGIMGGSPCPPNLVKDIISVMGIEEIAIGYGTTENSPCTFCTHPKDTLERKTETVGYILDHTEAKVVDPLTGEVVPLGQTGEIMIRGHGVMKGYWGEETKTEECITKCGWYKTGDIGSMDAYSYLQIKGRIKDMIIRGGQNIYPAEIEHFLHTHPKVKQAQVVGIEDFRMGEEVCACITLVEGQDCTAEEIRDYCKGKIAHFNIPRYVLFFTSYPLTPSGKVQKLTLRELAEEQLGIEK